MTQLEATIRRPRGAVAHFLVMILATILVLAASVSAGAAVPLTPAISAKQAEAAAARRELADLNARFEMKVEAYDAVAEALDRTRAEMEVTRVKAEEAEVQLAEAQDRLSSRALAIYTGGGVDMIAVLVGTSSFDDFLTRLDLLNRISVSDATLVSDVKGYRADIVASEVSLENREAEQIALRQEAEARRLEVEDALATQSAYVASLDSQVTALMRQEEERQRALAAERARRAAAAAARRPVPRKDGSAPGAPHPEAVNVVLRYIGVPYVWGGSSPSGFDCSGLTSYVYAQLGMDLPRTSRAQYRVGAFIAADRTGELSPGDLVFFGYQGDPERVHHVGLYVGDGNYVHAPGTGDRVKVSSLTERIASHSDYVGAVRP